MHETTSCPVFVFRPSQKFPKYVEDRIPHMESTAHARKGWQAINENRNNGFQTGLRRVGPTDFRDSGRMLEINQ